MNTQNTDPYAELKAAHAAGEVIEWRYKEDEDGPWPWCNFQPPQRVRWSSECEYRIKPEEPEINCPDPMACALTGKCGRTVSGGEKCEDAKDGTLESQSASIAPDTTLPEGCLPFDLEKAKAGHPIITRIGREAKFIAHVPESQLSQRVVVLIGTNVCTFNEQGGKEHALRPFLFLRAPRKVKREEWISFSKAALKAFSRGSYEAAKAIADSENKLYGYEDLVPARIEWEEYENPQA